MPSPGDAPRMDARGLFDALRASGLREFCGVPCSHLSGLTVAAEKSEDARYLPASVEGEAVAIAAGTWLGGEPAVVLLQDSGLRNAVNPLASPAVPYRIPLLLVASWRGQPGKKDAAH